MISNSHSHLVTCSAEPRKSSDDFWVPWRSQQCNRDVRQLTPTVGRVLPCCTYELTVGRRVASLQLTENLCHDDENSRQVLHCSDYQRVTDVTEVLTSKGRFLTKSICLSIFSKILHTRNIIYKLYLSSRLLLLASQRRRFLFVDVSDAHCYVVPIVTF